MQTLKEEVRNNISRAAVEEFCRKGFADASMREIAKKAGITVGNLYRYFKDKEDLFNVITEEAHTKIIDYVEQNLSMVMGRNYSSLFESVADTVLTIRKEHLPELFILFEGSRGTKHEKVKDTVIGMVEKYVQEKYLPEVKGLMEGIDPYLPHVIASGFIEGLIMINKRYEDSDQLRKAISQFIGFYFHNTF